MQLYSPRLVQNPSVKQRIRCKNGQPPLVANPSRGCSVDSDALKISLRPMVFLRVPLTAFLSSEWSYSNFNDVFDDEFLEIVKVQDEENYNCSTRVGSVHRVSRKEMQLFASVCASILIRGGGCGGTTVVVAAVLAARSSVRVGPQPQRTRPKCIFACVSCDSS